MALPPVFFDFKYGSSDWRQDREETFQKIKEVRTRYTVNDGQVVRTVETTREWASALSAVGTDPALSPPYFYPDKTYRADPAYIFQITRIKTTTFEEYSETSYRVTVDDFDVLANKHTITHQIIDGKIPLAPTKKSSLTNLILRPIVGTINQACDWVPNSVPLDLPYCESEEELGKAAKRQRQRDWATVRELEIPANPLMKVGQTLRQIDAARSIDKKGVIVALRHSQNPENGQARTRVRMEIWPK